MSDKGHERHFERASAVSALPPIATKSLHCDKWRSGPQVEIASTGDTLIVLTELPNATAYISPRRSRIRRHHNGRDKSALLLTPVQLMHGSSSFGLPMEELARLMSQWQERAMMLQRATN